MVEPLSEADLAGFEHVAQEAVRVGESDALAGEVLQLVAEVRRLQAEKDEAWAAADAHKQSLLNFLALLGQEFGWDLHHADETDLALDFLKRHHVELHERLKKHGESPDQGPGQGCY